MSSFHAPGSPAPSGVFGLLRSWLVGTSDRDASSASLSTNLSTSLSNDAAEPGGPCHGSTRVLVVDDNPVHLMVMSEMLASRGLVPCLAADGAEAVSLVSELHFDLVLMDLQMPVLDGLGATSAIRRFEALNARPPVPVVAYSSLTPNAGVLTTHGLNGSLNKPCEDHELEDCLVQWCPTYRVASALHEAEFGHGQAVWKLAVRQTEARPTSTG